MSGTTQDTMKHGSGETVYATFDEVFEARRVATCAQQIIPYFKAGQKILDVGCGHGSITIDMAKTYVPSGEFTALDRNEEWLKKARAAAERQGVQNIEWMHGDACDLSRFADGQFDIVHAHQVLLHLDTPVQALREMRRVCAPGGIVTVRDLATFLYLPEDPRLNKCIEMAGVAMKQSGGNLKGGQVNHSWAHEAGFPWDHIEMSAQGWDYSGTAGRRLWMAGATSIMDAPVRLGLATEEDRKNVNEAWKEWEADPAGRVMAVDGALVCRK